MVVHHGGNVTAAETQVSQSHCSFSAKAEWQQGVRVSLQWGSTYARFHHHPEGHHQLGTKYSNTWTYGGGGGGGHFTSNHNESQIPGGKTVELWILWVAFPLCVFFFFFPSFFCLSPLVLSCSFAPLFSCLPFCCLRWSLCAYALCVRFQAVTAQQQEVGWWVDGKSGGREAVWGPFQVLGGIQFGLRCFFFPPFERSL